MGEKPIFGLIFVFFSGKNRVSRPFFPAFLAVFSPIFDFLAHFFDFFLGLKIHFLGHNFDIFLGLKTRFLGHNSEIFLGQNYFFLGHFNLS